MQRKRLISLLLAGLLFGLIASPLSAGITSVSLPASITYPDGDTFYSAYGGPDLATVASDPIAAIGTSSIGLTYYVGMKDAQEISNGVRGR